MEFFGLLLGTLKLRPYVFLFLLFYLVALYRLFGWQRTLLFTGICWIIAFASEFSSTRTGFPYGLYHYIETTRDQELWISNVPFMDSLSYTFLQFAAFSTALFTIYPHRKNHLMLPERIAKPWRLAALSALLVTYLDIVIDPVAHQGEKWFLGKIYYYPDPGAYFDVPLSNFGGWYLVGFVSIGLYLMLERLLPARKPEQREFALPGGDCWGLWLYAAVVLFNLAVTLYIGDLHLFFAGLFIITLPLLLWIILFKRQQR